MSYTYPLPDLAHYDVSPKTGFLPETLPLTSLPSYYQPWERVASIIPALLLTKRIRSVVNQLPALSTSHLNSEDQWRRAYSILGFISHAYIWGVSEPTNNLPQQIAQPWLEVSQHLRLPPIATYAGLCLWNYKLILPSDSDDDFVDFMDNIQTINTFTGSTDESWFYLVSVFFEYKGAPCITTGLDAIKYARSGNTDQVISSLQKLAELIDYLGSLLMKMEEMCDPHVFYFRLRPYLAGWKNMQDAGLADGVYYGNEKTSRVYSGGSNAQSSLIQTLDLLLNVSHHSTGTALIDAKEENPFMKEMRNYMPGKHSDFLVHLSKVNVLRDFVLTNKDTNPELVLAYDAAVAMLKSFRDKHIQIVTRYIVIQAQKSKTLGSETTATLRAGLAKADNGKSSGGMKKEMRGTGGTALLPFLKQCRDETGNAAAGSWGKRILTYKRPDVKKENITNVADDVIGLGAQWRDDKSNTQAGHW
ncbi:hypothetical protein CANARDRAFT_8240 [[Candida] arabinofermentans NRRL YB-2248]|uniref:Indoleamine 2,3-dioxygenase n=1 Tax=[Candida] arabinofermentans NRRL YB-2248 TaxID=983967 RepID=A0A1E4SYS1_9ASCO|nr:hypothetical protein CANARDRAFT_8240 [[Candida] arabinofermentans NRRL YB-2248]